MARRNVIYVWQPRRNWRGVFAFIIGAVTFAACLSLDWGFLLSTASGVVVAGLLYGRRK